MNDFDLDSPDGSPPLVNILDEAFADEFGLSRKGSEDIRKLDGRAGGSHQQGSHVPSWSDLKTKAGKDRKRLPLACIACRRKKIRCSGEKPSCKHCLRSRIPCVYKVTTRKAAPRTDYMAMLDKRLRRMEERIIKIIPKQDRDATSHVTRAVVKPALPVAQSASKSTARKRTVDDITTSDLAAWAQPSSLAGTRVGNSGGTVSRGGEIEENELFREGLDALPPKDVQEHLAEVFFDFVYGQAYHLLHKPSYLRKLKTDTLPPVLVLSVCAVAARFTPTPHCKLVTRQFLRGEEWACKARDICNRRYEWPNLTILTSLLILGLHEFGTCQGGRSWALGGQAMRMAFALQLHKDLEYDPLSRSKAKLSFIDREIRRRLMWSCFLMDRFNSSGTDRPMFIRENSIKVPLPVKERYFQLDMPVLTETLDGKAATTFIGDAIHLPESIENMGVSAYLIRVVSLWGRIVTYVNQGGREKDTHPLWKGESEYAKLSKEVEHFDETLPESLKYTVENLGIRHTEGIANTYILLHLAIQQNILFVNKAALSHSEDTPDMLAPKGFRTKASNRTLAAANRISELIRDAEKHQYCVTAPFAGYCAFSSATVHVLGIFSGNPETKKRSEINAGINIVYLRKMMKYWGMFHWMVENIRSQVRTVMELAKSGKLPDPTDTSSWMLQYGDWFDRYPHGVTDADGANHAASREAARDADAAVLEQKPELHSVEEFFTNMSPAQTPASTNESPRPGPAKRRMTTTKQGSPARRPSSRSQDSSAAAAAVVAQTNSGSQEKVNSQVQNRRIAPNIAPEPIGNPVKPQVSIMAASPGSGPALLPSGTHTLPHVATTTTDPGNNSIFNPDLLSPMSISPLAGLPMSVDQVSSMTFNGFQLGQDIGISVTPMVSPVSWLNNPMALDAHKSGGFVGAGDFHFGMGPLDLPMQNQMLPDVVENFTDQDPSLAWFMPFNMEPPDINMGGGQQMDKRNSFPGPLGGDGDMGMMPPDAFYRGL